MRRCRKGLVFSFLALSMAAMCIPRAEARSRHSHRHRITHHIRHVGRRHHVIQCVAFVHQNTDFKIRGNARDWWGRAASLYARGNVPEVDSVLSFRPTRRMPLGHVALVRSILDNRTILIDQSHWASNGISRNVRVVDVSANNDWTAVRVALNGNTERLGSIYPTHGFIYNRTESSAPILIARRSIDSIETASASNTTDIFDDDAPNRSIQ